MHVIYPPVHILTLTLKRPLSTLILTPTPPPTLTATLTPALTRLRIHCMLCFFHQKPPVPNVGLQLGLKVGLGLARGIERGL